jgi:hypothetical protein
MFRLASGKFSRLDSLDEFKNRFKFMLRSVLTLRSSLRWLDTFIQNEQLLEFLRANPRLACKLHRPYLYQKLGTAGKLAILQQHYSLECARMPVRQLDILLGSGTLTLATLSGKDGSEYRFTLTHRHTFDKEGELSLQMLNASGTPLVTLTFTLCLNAQGAMLLIGGLQGPRRECDSQDAIKTATKACHGLFPKRVVMEALCEVVRMLGIHHIQAVSKQQHIYYSWRYRKHFEADYDSFWLALDATLNTGGFFVVPQLLPRKTMEQIASKKRAEYQRRYALFDDLNAQVASSLA